VVCHFSSWSSYGSYRDLWNWLASRMKEDRSLLVKFTARQFDHWGADLALGEQSIACTAAATSPMPCSSVCPHPGV
jgi:hypothetical protein